MSLPDAVTVNAGSTSVKVSRLLDGRRDPDVHTLDDVSSPPPVVLHRVVHGGDRTAPVVLTDEIVRELRALTELAPLHQPPALDAIDRCRRRWPDAVQIACFDTTFHTTLSPAARTYALPERLRNKVKVYGFHGLSYAWSSRQVASVVPAAGRVLIAHLGGGQSLCGVRDGRSAVTTMGFTPVDGLVMATRSGALDPGAVLYLNAHTDEDLEDVLETQSGLLGLAGTSDMREVLANQRGGDAGATLALDVWLHRFLREAGGCVAVLGGLDAIAFTGGIGENSDEIRQRVAAGLAWLGVGVRTLTATVGPIDEITASSASIRAFVVAAREDLQMLDEASDLLSA